MGAKQFCDVMPIRSVRFAHRPKVEDKKGKMLFPSNVFLFLFLPVTIIVYYLIPRRARGVRNVFLLVMSLGFYAWGEPSFLPIMLGLIIFDYIMAIIISSLSRSGPKRICLIVAIIGNLSILGVYKYLGFFTVNLNALLSRAGLQEISVMKLALPLGISFFTFQAMSYVIDVYRGTTKAQKKPWLVALYIAFFPQLIAGPIVRYNTIEEQLEGRCESFDEFAYGVRRFIIGFGKKVLIANNMAILADAAFAAPDAERSVAFAWIGALAYTFQIFFDFSGYSEMAIGLGRMFGFRFLENFNYPYITQSVSEFWRRWHISLGQWFRDYVYFPLGGSRVGSKRRLVFNLFVVWALTGVWHGASWNFVLWGLMYFVLIAFEKLTNIPKRFKNPAPRMLYRLFTLLCVVCGWVVFRAPGAREGYAYLMSMIGQYGNPLTDPDVAAAFRDHWFFMLCAVALSTPIFRIIKEKIEGRPDDSPRLDLFSDAPKYPKMASVMNVAGTPFYVFVFIWGVSSIILGSHNPFIYFNF
jgi:alginate O-acetyltransferase complex protein AlgI